MARATAAKKTGIVRNAYLQDAERYRRTGASRDPGKVSSWFQNGQFYDYDPNETIPEFQGNVGVAGVSKENVAAGAAGPIQMAILDDPQLEKISKLVPNWGDPNFTKEDLYQAILKILPRSQFASPSLYANAAGKYANDLWAKMEPVRQSEQHFRSQPYQGATPKGEMTLADKSREYWGSPAEGGMPTSGFSGGAQAVTQEQVLANQQQGDINAFWDEQVKQAAAMASGHYSPRAEAMRQEAKYLAGSAAFSGKNIGTERTAGDVATQQTARSAIPQAFALGAETGKLQDQAEGVGALQDIFGGKAEYTGGVADVDMVKQGTADWLKTAKDKLNQGYFGLGIQDYLGATGNQIRFKAGQLGDVSQQAKYNIQDAAKYAQQRGQVISGVGNALSTSFGTAANLYKKWNDNEGNNNG